VVERATTEPNQLGRRKREGGRQPEREKRPTIDLIDWRPTERRKGRRKRKDQIERSANLFVCEPGKRKGENERKEPAEAIDLIVSGWFNNLVCGLAALLIDGYFRANSDGFICTIIALSTCSTLSDLGNAVGNGPNLQKWSFPAFSRKVELIPNSQKFRINSQFPEIPN